MCQAVFVFGDTLSRAYLLKSDSWIEADVVMIHCLQLEESAKQSLCDGYLQDETMSKLRLDIIVGWNLRTKKQVHMINQPFCNFRDERDYMIIVLSVWSLPKRNDKLKTLLADHLGMDKCIKIAKRTVFWLW